MKVTDLKPCTNCSNGLAPEFAELTIQERAVDLAKLQVAALMGNPIVEPDVEDKRRSSMILCNICWRTVGLALEAVRKKVGR